MANRIKGLTVEIGGDTTGLSKSLGQLDKEIKSTQTELKDVEKLLKLDPTNTELLAQKQRLLSDAVSDTEKRLQTLRDASEQASKTKDNYDAWKEKYDPIQAEIDKTVESLKGLKEQDKTAKQQLSNGEISQEQYDKLQAEIKTTSDTLKALKDKAKAVSDEFGNPISPRQYDALQREIIETEQNLQSLQSSGTKTETAFDALKSKISEQQKELSSLKEQYQSAVLAEGENSDSAKELKEKYNQLNAELTESTKTLSDAEKAAESLGQSEQKAVSPLDSLKQTIADQKKELSSLKEQYQSAVLAEGENSDSAKELQQKYDALNAELSENSKKLADSEKSASRLGQTEKANLSPLDSLKKTIADQDKELSSLNDEYKNAVLEHGKDSEQAKTLASRIQTLSNEQKENKNQLQQAESAAQELNQEEKTLTERLSDQKSKLASLKTEYVNACATYGKNSDEAKALSRQIKDLSGEIESNEKTYNEAEQEANKFDKTVKDVGETSEKASGGISAAAVAVGTFVGNLASEVLSKSVDTLKQFATSAVQTGSELNSKMSGVAATLGYTMEQLHNPTTEEAQDMEKLTAKAKEMGKTTAFSSSEAADALNFMAMAGWKANQQLAAIEPVMNLASASGEDLGTVADIVTDSMTALGLEANDAGKYADILAKTSSNANTNVGMLGESFKYAAPIIGTMSKDEEQAAKNTKDLAIALGSMANAGIKGEQAGSALRNGIINLVKPTKQQAEAMKQLGLIATETKTVFDDKAIEKAQSRLEDKTAYMTNKQIDYNDAVAKYGENSSQAQKALNNLQTAERHLTEAQNALTEAQQGTIETVAGQSVFVDEAGNMKNLGQIIDILRTTLGDCNAELFDSEGNLKDYDAILSEVEQSEDGLTKAEQLKNAAIIFGKQNVAGMLSLINTETEDYAKLTDAIYNSEGAAEEMAKVKLDNLAGDVTLLKSAFSGLQESLFDDLDRPLRKIVQALTNKLLPALTGVIEGKDGADKVLSSAVVKVLTTLSVQLNNVLSKFGEILNTVFSAMVKALPQFTQIAVKVVTGLIQGLIQNLPLLVNAVLQLTTALLTSLMQMIPQVIPVVTEIVKTLANGLIENLPLILEATVTMIGELVKGIAENLPIIVNSALAIIQALVMGLLQALPELLAMLPELVQSLANGLLESIDMIISTGLTLFLALVDALPEIIEGILAVLPTIITSIVGGLLERLPDIIQAGIMLLTALVNALPEIIESIIAVIPDIITAIVDAVLLNLPLIIQAGFDLIVALVEKSDEIIDTIVKVVPEIIGALIASIVDNLPQIVEAGAGILVELGNGIANTIDSVYAWGSDIVDNLVEGIFGGIGKIADASEKIGEKIWEYLHFSEPEKGKLADFSSWMPDFMGGLANGITSNQIMIENAVNGCSQAIATLTQNHLENLFANIQNKTITSLKSIFSIINNSLNAMQNSNKKSLENIHRDTVSGWNAVNDSTFDLMSINVTNVRNQLDYLSDVVMHGLNRAFSHIHAQIESSWQWGYDLMQNLINGIRYQLGDLRGTVEEVANTIREYLHFSVPDKGPLTDFENWMPDFMSGLAKGLTQNKDVLENAVKGVSEMMRLTMDSSLTYSLDMPAMIGATSGTVNNYYTTDNSQTFNQTNNSPKSLSRYDIYRQTQTLVRSVKKVK